jgi:hypothetical protein
MTTYEHASMMDRSRTRSRPRRVGVPVRSFSVSLSTIGILTVAISAWGAIVPYVGPTFAFSADGSGSWHWSLTHSVLALVPGALGCLIGLSFLARIPGARIGRRKASLGAAGLVAIACGAWFVIGPLAWRVIDNVGPYFVTASPLRELANQAGYSLGPGLILGLCGAFALGWATRHTQPLETSASDPDFNEPVTAGNPSLPLMPDVT